MEIERRPIFDGIFEVSANGRVFRVKSPNGRSRPRELKTTTDPRYGYVRVGLSINGKSKGYFVHVLVLLAFKGRCPEGLESAHLNGVRHDNRIENLAYVTRKENHAHKKIHGTAQYGERQGQSKLTEEAVQQIRLEYPTKTSQSDLPGAMASAFKRCIA